MMLLSNLVWAETSTDTTVLDDSELDEALDFLNEEDPVVESPKEAIEEKTVVEKEAVPLNEPLILEPVEEKPVEVLKENLPKKTAKILEVEKNEEPLQADLPLSQGSSGYRFAEHLPEAEAVLYSSQRKPEVTAVWKDHKFIFKGYQDEVEIKKASYKVEAFQREAIAIKLMPGRAHVLKFPEVPSGAQLTLSYNLASATTSPNPSFAYLRIFVGDKQLKRIQISSKDPWKENKIDLGILAFLSRNTAVTFEVIPERVKGLTLSLVAQIKK